MVHNHDAFDESPSAGEQTRGQEISSLVCRKGKSTKAVSINGCSNIAYRTQKGVFYRGPTRCHTTFKVNKEQCSEATFSCSFSSIPNKKKKCTRGDSLQVKHNGKTQKFCKRRRAKISFTTSLKVSFIAYRKLKGKGAVCNVRCSKTVTHVCPRIKLEGVAVHSNTDFDDYPEITDELGVWEASCQFYGGCPVYKMAGNDLFLFKANETTWITSSTLGEAENNTLRLTTPDCYIDESHNQDYYWDYYSVERPQYGWYSFNHRDLNSMNVTCV